MNNLAKGHIIQGKWTSRNYEVIEKLGEGCGGVVYKVLELENQGIMALKISSDVISLNREYIYAKELGKIMGVIKVYQVDDTEVLNQRLGIYTMEFIEGDNLINFYKGSKGISGLVDTIIVVLSILEEIYKAGYIYCDLKPQNIMVSPKSGITLIDFGGIVSTGKTVKEFCFLYDRGSWGRGSMVAQQSYTIFSMSMITYFVLFNSTINPSCEGYDIIINNLKLSNLNRGLKSILLKGLTDRYNSIRELKKDLMTSRNSIAMEERKRVQSFANNVWVDTFFVTSICLFIFVFSYILTR